MAPYRKGYKPMLLSNGHSITPKQTKIIVILFLLRGMLFEQVSKKLAEVCERPLTETFRQNTYKDLQKMEKKFGLIKRDPIKMERTRDFIYLTEEGLEIASQLLDIAPGKVGSGFFGDHGDFPYDLHRPPKGTFLHHVQLTDTLLEIERLQSKYPEAGLAYRDNRYSSVEYEWEGKKYRFRPDGEILINGIPYFLEIDRGTEFLESLKAKFERYNQYFAWLKKRNELIPAGVIIVCSTNTPIGLKRRFSTFLNAFMCHMSAWYLEFNLSFGTIGDLERIVNREVDAEHLFNQFRTIIPHYHKTEHGIGKLQFVQNQAGLSCSQGMRYSITKNSNGKRIFAYERFEHAESRSVARLLEFYKAVKATAELKDAVFVPVLYYSEGEPIVTSFNGFNSSDMLNTAFSNPLWLRIKEGMPYWSDSKGKKIPVGNALL